MMNCRLPKMKKFVLLILLIFNFTFLIFNSAAYAAADGGLPGYFLNQGVGARAFGMGRAFAAVADDASGIYWNPAGLIQLQRKELQLMHIILFEDTRYEFIGYVHPTMGLWSFALGGIQLYSGGFERRDEDNNPIGTFADENNALFLTNTFELYPKKFALGLTAKAVNKKFEEINSTGYGLDCSLFLRPFSFITFGLNAQNVLGAKIEREALTDQIPLNLKAGLAVRAPKNIVIFAVDIDRSGKKEGKYLRENKYHFGIELNPLKTLSLRAGFDQENPTGGIGLNTENLDLDYALLKHSELGLSHRLSLGLKFGKSKKEIEEEIFFREQKQAEINSLFEQGQISLENKDWLGAREKFQKVLALDKENKEAKDKLTQIESNLKAINLYLKNGKGFFAAREWDKAISEFEQVLTLDPKNKEAIEYKKKTEEEKIKRKKGINIAVAEFEARNVSQMDAVTISDFLRTELVKSGAFNVVDRSNMQKILAEQRFQMTGCTTQECAVQMGRLLNVQKVIVGTFSKLMDAYYVIVNVVDVETGKIEFSEQVKALTSDEIVNACGIIARKIIEKYK